MKTDIIGDKAGRPVDCSGHQWSLNVAGAPITLDWSELAPLPPAIQDAARRYARYKLPHWAPDSLGGLFYMFRRLANCPFFDRYEGTMTARVFEDLRDDPKVHGPDLTRFRGWYRWAAAMEMPGFDPEVSEALREIRIGDNPRGKVARKKDPKQGPLNDSERQELLFQTLEAPDGKLPLRERVAILLSMGLGANAGPLSLLQVDDYSFKFSGGTKYCLLQVPRHKKGFERERSDFRPRQIDGDCAQYLERLIAYNRATVDHVYERSTGKPRPPTVAVPIFMRDHVRADLQPSMGEYALHLTPLEFTGLLQNASRALNIHSRFGGMLHLNARRLRSTFATNLIADGKSTRVVADALDHSSTRHVTKYEFANHRLSKALDARIGDAMNVVAQAFLGTLIEKGGDRPRPPSTILYFDQEEDQPGEIGNCGQDHVCGRAALLACYSCSSFQAWTDAPHEKLLAQLKRARAQRATSSMHPRIVQLNDRDIQAVSEVVSAIASLKSNANGKKTN